MGSPPPPSAVPGGGTGDGSRRVDTADSKRIPILMETVAALSRAVEPQDVLRVFAQRGGELYGPRGYLSISVRGLPPGCYRITPLLKLDGTDPLMVADPWLHPEELPVRRGGFFGEIIRKASPELVHHLRLRGDPVIGDGLEGYGSLMAIPVFDDGEPVNWAVFLRREPEGFSVDELEQAILRANLVGTAVKSALIARELRQAHARIRAEVQRIASIQRALLPRALPHIPGLSIAASYEVFDTAGGDYYDFRPLGAGEGCGVDPHGPWGILIADASGHGPSAAVVMAMIQSILHAYPGTPRGPAELLEHLNAHLCGKRIENSFVTAFLAVFDPRTRSLVYARAGHDPPLLGGPRPGALVTALDAVGGVPLGVVEGVEYDQARVDLRPRQTMVLYTDGISEALSPDGRMFGRGGIERAIASCAGAPESVVRSITEPLLRHVAGNRPRDDQTIVAIRVEE